MKINCFILSLLLLSVVSCTSESELEVKDKLRPVRIMQIGESDVLSGRQFSAVVEAEKESQLSFGASGKIEKFEVKESQKVMSGEMIAELDDTDAKIKLKSSRADYDKAKADFNRASELVKQGHISRSDYDQVNAKYVNAEAQLAAAEQGINNTKIKAPFTGVIAKRLVKKYEEVSANQVVVELHDLSSLLVKINVSEKIMQVSQRNKMNRSFYVVFDGFKDQQFPVYFKEVVTRADDDNQTYETTFSLPLTKNKLILPGMTGVLTVDQQNSSKRIIVPANVVLSDVNGKFVYILDHTPEKQSLVKRQNVVVGALLTNGVEITSGLQNGDKVVTAGMSKLADGMEVKSAEGAY